MTNPNVDLFMDTKAVVDPDKDYYQELVGEGKKFQDNKGLARGKVESDLFIERLTAEQKELRDTLTELQVELNKRKTLEEVMDNLKNNRDNVNESNNQNQIVPEVTQPNTNVKELVQNLFQEFISTKEKDDNFTKVQNRLTELYGNSTSTILESKIQELGVTKEFANNLARDNPNAFLKIFGQEKTQTQINPTRTSVITGLPSGRKKFSDFAALRKSDPATYFSPAVRQELYRLTEEFGDEFLKS